jgi:hypothetical protein
VNRKKRVHGDGVEQRRHEQQGHEQVSHRGQLTSPVSAGQGSLIATTVPGPTRTGAVPRSWHRTPR